MNNIFVVAGYDDDDDWMFDHEYENPQRWIWCEKESSLDHFLINTEREGKANYITFFSVPSDKHWNLEYLLDIGKDKKLKCVSNTTVETEIRRILLEEPFSAPALGATVLASFDLIKFSQIREVIEKPNPNLRLDYHILLGHRYQELKTACNYRTFVLSAVANHLTLIGPLAEIVLSFMDFIFWIQVDPDHDRESNLLDCRYSDEYRKKIKHTSMFTEAELAELSLPALARPQLIPELKPIEFTIVDPTIILSDQERQRHRIQTQIHLKLKFTGLFDRSQLIQLYTNH